MNFEVIWQSSAEGELASLWTQAANPTEIAQAADALDRSLSRNPLSLGESRGGPTRIAFEKPLGILFNVNPISKRVVVLGVWRW